MTQFLGKLHHFGLTVTDMGRSEAFDGSILEYLGYAPGQEIEDPAATAIIWSGPGGAISIWPCNPDCPNKQWDMHSPGRHHVALAADSREQVDQFHEHLKTIGANILNAPAEYGYMPGYYALFFTDPDGIKLELAHTPDFPPA
ncbi:hypothetical protein BTW10_10385 [Chromohalobacter japonicus]|uniref:VOC domain-containing protein n=1 Tax=Chromohalobacter japonicus TaxID=223900 RepID=A0A1Q8TBX8_9GAMM|nr:VOC family protein [Chromohalobacter japonicus]OLO11199.1 hypothetical protein BTW10_10385 [Chromohalobacter japonicus]